MKTDTYDTIVDRRHCAFTATLLLFLLSGCSALLPTASPQHSTFYSLNPARNTTSPNQGVGRTAVLKAPTLLVSPVRATAGFDSHRIIYVRQPHKLEYFARSEWIDTPSRMLAPLVALAIESSGAFRAVVSAPSSASADLQLDMEILQLQHEFSESPSRVRFAVRVHLVEEGRRQVIASRDFESVVLADSDDPYGGVLAANSAVQTVLAHLSAFCAEAASDWQMRERDNDPALRNKLR